MKDIVTWVPVAAIVIGLMAVTWISGNEQLATQGVYGGGVPDESEDCCGQGPGTSQARKLLVPPVAYLRVTDEAETLWRRVRDLEERLHETTWELSMLHTQGAADAEVNAKAEELRSLTKEFHTEREALREHTVYPAGMYGGMQAGGMSEESHLPH